MRQQLNMIIGRKDHEYSDIVCEYLFIESKLIKNKGYVTSEKDFILQAKWIKV